MRKLLTTCALTLAGLALVGCSTNIPPKLQVRDVSSGRLYTTYQSWGDVQKGVGYSFTDIETGKRITLTNYELNTLEGKKSVPKDSPEAQKYAEAAARGGVK